MADSRFFRVAGPFTLGALAQAAGATLAPDGDPSLVFSDVAPLHHAGPADVSFLDNRKYVSDFKVSRAGACVVHPDLAGQAPPGMALLISSNPYRSYALVATLFYPNAVPAGVISPGAHIDPNAVIGAGTDVAAGAVIGPEVRIGVGCRIGANAVIERGVEIGDHTIVGSNASLAYCLIGNHVYIYPGVRIGQDGFGFAIDPGGYVRVPQIGRVIVEDHVEIGANSTVDRGSGGDTVIGRGSMIDNLVQIGHNVQVGAGCIIIAQAGVAGSSKLGHHVVVAAQVGVAGHLTVGDGARIAAQSGVMRNVPAGAEVCGAPAVPIKQFFRQVATLVRLASQGEHGTRGGIAQDQ
ncbi:MAG: UDP-3-O-(3-hydroxymyristoyl)glucosamine N-acyltransferase [Azospirillaceae bacterium]|nr:UDP-3-O-(3-hydroxymyristoyl)glucosamine N-acyltransferase [Azospirillaceae bacterium]